MKKTLEDEINEFMIYWDKEKFSSFMSYVFPLFDLWDVKDGEIDWLEQVAEEDHHTIRLIRTVYLLSRISEFHAGSLTSTNVRFKKLWKRMEKEGMIENKKPSEEIC